MLFVNKWVFHLIAGLLFHGTNISVSEYGRNRKMKDDPIIESIRSVRRKIAEECDFDTTNLIKHYQEEEKKTTRKFFQRIVKESKNGLIHKIQ